MKERKHGLFHKKADFYQDLQVDILLEFKLDFTYNIYSLGWPSYGFNQNKEQHFMASASYLFQTGNAKTTIL